MSLTGQFGFAVAFKYFVILYRYVSCCFFLQFWDPNSKRIQMAFDADLPSSSSNWKSHRAVLFVLLWTVSGTFLRKWLEYGSRNTNNYAQVWLACMVAPPGVWIRWFLARLNGRGLGRKGSMKWIPFGTRIANVSATSMMTGLATVKTMVKTEKLDIIATGIQLVGVFRMLEYCFYFHG